MRELNLDELECISGGEMDNVAGWGSEALSAAMVGIAVAALPASLPIAVTATIASYGLSYLGYNCFSN